MMLALYAFLGVSACVYRLHALVICTALMLVTPVCCSLVHICLPFLIYVTHWKFNQSRGSVPVSMDFWYILVSPGASCLAHSFNILFGMLSGTEALEGFIFLSNFSIPSDRISRSGIDLLVCFVVFGSVLFNSLVNTDLNWFISMCAFRLLSFTSCSLLFSGDTPMLSCFRDLTYFQNGFELLFWCPSIIVSFI
jgi:hypothetical protein